MNSPVLVPTAPNVMSVGFEYKGVKCLIQVKMKWGTAIVTGYAQVPERSPLYGVKSHESMLVPWWYLDGFSLKLLVEAWRNGMLFKRLPVPLEELVEHSGCELTFTGTLPNAMGWYIGVDLAHEADFDIDSASGKLMWNKTREHVVEQIELLVDCMLRLQRSAVPAGRNMIFA